MKDSIMIVQAIMAVCLLVSADFIWDISADMSVVEMLPLGNVKTPGLTDREKSLMAPQKINDAGLILRKMKESGYYINSL